MVSPLTLSVTFGHVLVFLLGTTTSNMGVQALAIPSDAPFVGVPLSHPSHPHPQVPAEVFIRTKNGHRANETKGRHEHDDHGHHQHDDGHKHENENEHHNFNRDTSSPHALAQLLEIAPQSSACASSVPYPAECATANNAVNAIEAGFETYNTTNPAEMAAILSWIAFESAEFKYNMNHFPAPGRPGQGTRAMMMPNFVKEFATDVLGAKAVSAAGGDPAKILALVEDDAHSFAAGAWYYAKHCTEAQKEQIRSGSESAWETAFVTGCVGTTVTEDRRTYWTRACDALGVKKVTVLSF